MSSTRVVSVALTLVGGLLCLGAAIAGGLSATAFVSRIRNGRGIMFADAEFLALAALALLVPGLTLLVVGRHLGRRSSQRDSEGIDQP